jgi:hypothetical protein
MEIKRETNNTLSPGELKGLLAEYDSLRSEILGVQTQRMQIISLTIGALGAVLSITGGIVLGTENIDALIRLLVATGGAVAAYVIIIPSLIMIISAQQAVQRLGGYIRIFIEPLVPGLNWQSRWQNYKAQYQYRGGLRGMGGIYYFLSILPLLLPAYALSQYLPGWGAAFILIPFFLWSVYLSYDLQSGRSKGWKWAHWEDYTSKYEQPDAK